MLIALATDGDDGPTDAAGAVATGESAQRAAMLGLDAAGHLSRNDAYPFFLQLGDLIKERSNRDQRERSDLPDRYLSASSITCRREAVSKSFLSTKATAPADRACLRNPRSG